MAAVNKSAGRAVKALRALTKKRVARFLSLSLSLSHTHFSKTTSMVQRSNHRSRHAAQELRKRDCVSIKAVEKPTQRLNSVEAGCLWAEVSNACPVTCEAS